MNNNDLLITFGCPRCVLFVVTILTRIRLAIRGGTYPMAIVLKTIINNSYFCMKFHRDDSEAHK